MLTKPPLANKIVLIGGGHTHALFLKAWTKNPLSGVALTVIDPNPIAPYTGMLPGHIGGHYKLHELEIDLVKLTRQSNAQVILDRAIGIDIAHKQINLESRPRISFDLASIDIGITSELPSIVGFSDFAIPAKPLHNYAYAWNAYLGEILGGEKKPFVCVIGGGIAGFELALAMHHKFRSSQITNAKITIVEKAQDVLSGTSERTQRVLLHAAASANIRIIKGVEIREIRAQAVLLKTGDTIHSEFTVGAAGATPHPWIKNIGLKQQGGFVQVNEFLQTSDPHIFATGDCAHMSATPRPKAGVFAVRQAPVLFHNIRASLLQKKLKSYKPQKHFLKLISLGKKDAVADSFGMSLSGPLLWKLKDHIDRKFMAGLTELALPKSNSPPQNLPIDVQNLQKEYDHHCAGCGSKLGPMELQNSLGKSCHSKSGGIHAISGDDAAILTSPDGFQVISTDHLRAFSLDPFVVGKAAAVHALGDIWAMGAEAQAVLVSIILPQASREIHKDMMREIMQGIREVIDETPAEIVGGHTSIGADLTIGLTVTGTMASKPISLNGANTGDQLILTKGLGSGVILAGEMRSLANGRIVENLYRHMCTPSQFASKILKEAHAMTDVTGFGLAGHLLNILRASDKSARIYREKVPMIPGALELSERGVKSSLWQANRDFANLNHTNNGVDPLLFDPQTSGGLLACVPRSNSDQLLIKLKEYHPEAAIIGEIVDPKGEPTIFLE